MYEGATIPIPPGEEVTIGRDAAKAHLVIEHGAGEISGLHCGVAFDMRKNRYRVTDYSRNGTFTENGDRLTANMATVVPRGTLIYLSGRENSFRLN
jgi:hypothetical protein